MWRLGFEKPLRRFCEREIIFSIITPYIIVSGEFILRPNFFQVLMTDLGYEFLYEVTNQGIAERISEEERDAIHIETPLDDKIRREISQGNQVVLTGNPGDGKSQYVQKFKTEFNPPDYYYVVDASEYEIEELAEEWRQAVTDDKAGIVAINDGILNNLAEWAQNSGTQFDFLVDDVLGQLEGQIVHGDPDTVVFDSRFTTIDLGNRSFIAEAGGENDAPGAGAVRRVIMKLTSDIAPDTREEATNHAESNAVALQDELVIETLGRLLTRLDQTVDHMTVRDVLNFISYCITGGQKEPDEEVNINDPSYNLHYYNLAQNIDGVYLSQQLAKHFDPHLTSLPTIDIQLWDEIEEGVSYSDYNLESLKQQYICLKRAALFGDEAAPPEYSDGFIRRFLQEQQRTEFEEYIRNDVNRQVIGFVRLLNNYFVETPHDDTLRIWFDHNYEYGDPDVLVSGNTVSTSEFNVEIPELHPTIEDALGYTPPYFVFEYNHSGETIAELRVDYSLFRFLKTGGEETPASISSQSLENRVIQFMEQIYRHHTDSEDDIRIKHKQSDAITQIKISPTGHAYSLE